MKKDTTRCPFLNFFSPLTWFKREKKEDCTKKRNHWDTGGLLELGSK